MHVPSTPNKYIVQQLQQNGLGLSRNLERYVYVSYNGRQKNWKKFQMLFEQNIASNVTRKVDI